MKHTPTNVASLRARARVRKRRAQRAPDWRQIYLATLVENGGQTTAAARSARVTIRTVQRHRVDDHGFRKAEADALEIASQVLEDEAIRRAVEGVDCSYRYTGRNGSIHEHRERKYSDTLLLRLLERLETGTWRRNPQVESTRAFATRAERKAALEKARVGLR